MNEYCGYEIDFYFVYEKNKKEKEGNINIEGNDDINIKGEEAI